jgi:prolyl-tRNA editing enzyme YbaK/EbsC (Cys-tRNA(Pro) deacylase)
MSSERARAYLEKLGAADRIKTFDVSTATVELAAKAAGVIPARIAKTLCFKMGEGCLLVVAAGDARVDNKKFKARFGAKASMLPPEDVERLVGHSVGGVCPFGIGPGVPVYLDDSLKRFETVLPAAGSANNCIELNLQELFELSAAEGWVDVCKM